MYCITLNDSHYEKIKNLGYVPVGLGNNIKNPIARSMEESKL